MLVPQQHGTRGRSSALSLPSSAGAAQRVTPRTATVVGCSSIAPGQRGRGRRWAACCFTGRCGRAGGDAAAGHRKCAHQWPRSEGARREPTSTSAMEAHADSAGSCLCIPRKSCQWKAVLGSHSSRQFKCSSMLLLYGGIRILPTFASPAFSIGCFSGMLCMF